MAKRIFDFFFSLSALLLLSAPMIIIWLVAAVDTKSGGIFVQRRIGKHGKIFKILKFRTIRSAPQRTKNEITAVGSWLRKYKFDELPQLLNVLIGQMSIVGPRPDIAGYYDTLTGEARKILELKPGLTNAASIKYFNEELMLSQMADAQRYNDEVIFPDKVKMNLEYYYNRSFMGDIKIILKTLQQNSNE